MFFRAVPAASGFGTYFCILPERCVYLRSYGLSFATAFAIAARRFASNGSGLRSSGFAGFCPPDFLAVSLSADTSGIRSFCFKASEISSVSCSYTFSLCWKRISIFDGWTLTSICSLSMEICSTVNGYWCFIKNGLYASSMHLVISGLLI